MIPPPLLRRMRLTSIALVLCLGALGWWFLGRSPDSALGLSPPQSRRLNPIPLADVHPWGANFFLEREVEAWKRELTVDMARDAGLRFAKQHLLWSEVEREQGVFDWAKYDAIVSLYREAGIEVIFRVDWPPQWATGEFDAGANGLPKDPDDYARFLGEAVAHFQGRVRFFQVWNEPNLSSEWGWLPADPAAYVDLLARSAATARAADPDVVILAAPLAINNEDVSLAGNLNDLDYLRGMYEAGAREHFDVLAANAFGKERPPDDAPAPDVLNVRRTELQRTIMEEFDDERKAIWFSEYGWTAAPEWVEDNIWGRVDESVQATWTVDGVSYAQAQWPWAGVFGIWYFRRERFLGEFADSYFQMVSVDFVAKRVYDAVREVAFSDELLVATPGYWQERSAPVQPESLDDWAWQRADGASDEHALVARSPDASLTMRFHGRSVSVRALQGPQAGGLRVHVDGRELASISLKEGQGWEEVVLADGLDLADHELRIGPWRAGGELSVDVFRVDAGGAPQNLPAAPIALGLLATGLAVLLMTDLRRAVGRARL